MIEPFGGVFVTNTMTRELYELEERCCSPKIADLQVQLLLHHLLIFYLISVRICGLYK